MQKFEKPIYVTQPVLPSLNEFTKLLEDIWQSKHLTNGGKYHELLEKTLADYLGVKYVSLFSNGTLALIIALQTLRITGEVITTPFSFVATTHALWWNGIKPVFADIDINTLNINPLKVEAAITPKTTAIMPVHVFGNPCEIDVLQKIADTYRLKIIYDAAHAFGVKRLNKSILNFGDLSVLSFHATKVFNTIEGGAIICHDEQTKINIDYLKNFGYSGEFTVVGPGINAKMNELQAAYGLLQLKSIECDIEKRKQISATYRNLLNDVNGILALNDWENIQHNYAYFPILIEQNQFGRTRDEVYDFLRTKNVYARKYFYPLISEFSTYQGLDSATAANLPIATKVAKQVLCLPIYPNLEVADVEKICDFIKSFRG